MAYDIRPLSFSEILDRAVYVYRDNFALLTGIAAVFWIPTAVLHISANLLGHGFVSKAHFIFVLVGQPVMGAAMVLGVASIYLDRRISVGGAYRETRPIIPKFLGTEFLYFPFVVIAFAGVTGAFRVATSIHTTASPERVVRLTLLMPLIVVAMFFLVRWCLAASVMIVERRFGRSAFRRSKELIVGSWWQTFGIVLMVFSIEDLPVRALQFVWGFVPVISAILTAATHAVIDTYGVIAMVIYYFDRRCRTEEFDLRLLAEQVRAETQPSMSPAPDSSALA
jgi:hypothetical protein